MMGTRTRLHGGDEHDAFSGWRRVMRWHAGQRRAIKQTHNQRARKQARLTLAREVAGLPPRRGDTECANPPETATGGQLRASASTGTGTELTEGMPA